MSDRQFAWLCIMYIIRFLTPMNISFATAIKVHASVTIRCFQW